MVNVGFGDTSNNVMANGHVYRSLGPAECHASAGHDASPQVGAAHNVP